MSKVSSRIITGFCIAYVLEIALAAHFDQLHNLLVLVST